MPEPHIIFDWGMPDVDYDASLLPAMKKARDNEEQREEKIDVLCTGSIILLYPIQIVTEIYKKVTEPSSFVSELENSSWNVLCLLRSEVAYIGTGHILP